MAEDADSAEPYDASRWQHHEWDRPDGPYSVLYRSGCHFTYGEEPPEKLMSVCVCCTFSQPKSSWDTIQIKSICSYVNVQVLYWKHLLFYVGRQIPLWLCLWDQCHRLHGDVHPVDHAEFPDCVLWLCSQRSGLLPSTHGGTICIRSHLFPTVSRPIQSRKK